jgi:glycosyltransferase involved in cell wall biosynthesis
MSAVPLISIVTPSLNQGRFLRDCIEGVLKQNDPAFEHIIIDGGSTDETVPVLESFPHLVWKSGPDGGQADAIAKALALARGEIIGWINADDFYYPAAFQAVRDAFRADPGLDVVTGNYCFTDAQGRTVRRRRETGFDYESYLYGGKSYLANSAAFFRKRILDRFGGPRRDLHHSLDYELFLRLGKSARMAHIPQFLASYRLHPASKTALDPARRDEEMRKIRLEYLSAGSGSVLTEFPREVCVRQFLAQARRVLRKLAAGCYSP